MASLAVALLATPAQAHGPAPRIGYATSVAVSDVPPVRFVSALVAEAERHLGQGNFTGRPGAWCAWAISAWLRAIGRPPLASGMAASALAYGPRTNQPRPGDLVVMRGHVTIFVRYDGNGWFTGLGGNQHHMVRYSRFALRSVVGFVRV